MKPAMAIGNSAVTQAPLPGSRPPGRAYTRACLLFFGAALLYAGWVETMSQMRSAERFALVALEVRGIRMLEGADVLDASGLAVGDNVFAVNLDSVALRLESLVWVRQARVERKPPDRLIVWVDERTREAWIDTGESMFGVDGDGVLLPEQAMPAETPKDLDLPVIDLKIAGRDAAPEAGRGLVAGDTMNDSTLTAILGWWRHAREHDVSFSRQISELQPFGSDGLRVLLGGDGLEIRLPLTGERLGDHLQTLNSALPAVYGDVTDPGYVDLRFTDQLVVGSAESAATQRLQHKRNAPKPGTVPEPRKAQLIRERPAPAPSSARGDYRG